MELKPKAFKDKLQNTYRCNKGKPYSTGTNTNSKSFTYANEADMLNVALFGMTAREWRDANPDKSGNIRDYATLNQLLVLANMESYNAILIN